MQEDRTASEKADCRRGGGFCYCLDVYIVQYRVQRAINFALLFRNAYLAEDSNDQAPWHY